MKLIFPLIILSLFLNINVIAQESGFNLPKSISSNFNGNPLSLQVSDFDNDGDNDVLFLSKTQVGWFENADNEYFMKSKSLEGINTGFNFFARDFDQDSDTDILVANKEGVVYLYTNIDDRYSESVVVTGISNDQLSGGWEFPLTIADINNDGQDDVITVQTTEDGCQEIVVFLNISSEKDQILFNKSSTVNPCVDDIEGPTSLSITDINNDSLPDIVAKLSNHLNTRRTVYYKQSESFEFEQETLISTGYRNNQFMDYDGDGDQDSIIEYIGGAIGWLEQNESGEFTPIDEVNHLFYTKSHPVQILLHDIDQDGKKEFIYTRNIFLHFLNLEPGLPINDQSFPIADSSFSYDNVPIVKFEDINSDSIPDILGLKSYSNTKISCFPILENMKVGNQIIIAGEAIESPLSTVTLDANSDGYLDIITQAKQRLSIHLQTPIGTYTETVLDRANSKSAKLKLLDTNNDGLKDLVFNNSWVFENDPNGLFHPKKPLAIDGQNQPINLSGSIAIVDLDLDDDLDIICGNCAHEFYHRVNQKIDTTMVSKVYYNNGQGQYTESAEFDAQETSFFRLYDLDNDGDLDLFASNYNSLVYFENTDGYFHYGLQNDEIIEPSTVREFSVELKNFEIADLDKNGHPEIVWNTHYYDYRFPSTLSSYGIIRNIKPDLSHKISVISDNFNAHQIQLIDLNGDTYDDIVTVNSGSKISWQLNNRSAHFYNSIHLTTNATPGTTISFGDIDNDGYEDLIATQVDNLIQVFGNQTYKLPVDLEGWEQNIPVSFKLYQNYPNPFNPTTNIDFHLNETSEISLSVFNAKGQKVSTLFKGLKIAGYHTITVNATELSSGVYFYILKKGMETQTRKMVLIK